MKKFTHFTCYLALALAYGAAYFGIDKTSVMATTSLLYFILAADELRDDGDKH